MHGWQIVIISGKKECIMKRIALLTSGGDCQALNATMRGVVKGLSNNIKDLEVYGFLEGYKGMIYGNYKLLTSDDFSGILTRGGTIIGSSRQPFKLMRVPDENGLDKVEAMKQNYYKLRLDCVVILGGNGTQKTANLLREEGLNVIHLPKTIDNDIYGTDLTFGYQSAIDIATTAIDQIHTTASSHGRVFIVEVMGHKVGWLTLSAGLASGADVILLPEIPYDLDKVCEAIERRHSHGKKFTILAVAEGAISKEMAAMKKKDRKKAMEKLLAEYPSVSYKLAHDITERTGSEVRVTVPGHVQRGGSPDPFDRVLSTKLGVYAAQLIEKGEYGYMVATVNNEICKVPLELSAGQLKGVDPEDQTVQLAKYMGISFGD
jgi:6-phosphofructokinase 1